MEDLGDRNLRPACFLHLFRREAQLSWYDAA